MKQAGEIKKLPKARSSEGPRAGRLTVGKYWTKAFNRLLSLELVDDIDAWAMSLKKGFPTWQAIAVTSQYGKGEHRGYGSIYYQLPHPEAGDFAIELTLATGKHGSRSGGVSHLRDLLQERSEGLLVL